MVADRDPAKKAKADYYREWRRKNRDKVRKYNENYWQRKAAKGGDEDAEAPGTE